MLTTSDNELMTRRGPGTPMGVLLRQYRASALLFSEVTAEGPACRGDEPEVYVIRPVGALLPEGADWLNETAGKGEVHDRINPAR